MYVRVGDTLIANDGQTRWIVVRLYDAENNLDRIIAREKKAGEVEDIKVLNKGYMLKSTQRHQAASMIFQSAMLRDAEGNRVVQNDEFIDAFNAALQDLSWDDEDEEQIAKMNNEEMLSTFCTFAHAVPAADPVQAQVNPEEEAAEQQADAEDNALGEAEAVQQQNEQQQQNGQQQQQNGQPNAQQFPQGQGGAGLLGAGNNPGGNNPNGNNPANPEQEEQQPTQEEAFLTKLAQLFAAQNKPEKKTSNMKLEPPKRDEKETNKVYIRKVKEWIDVSLASKVDAAISLYLLRTKADLPETELEAISHAKSTKEAYFALKALLEEVPIAQLFELIRALLSTEPIGDSVREFLVQFEKKMRDLENYDFKLGDNTKGALCLYFAGLDDATLCTVSAQIGSTFKYSVVKKALERCVVGNQSGSVNTTGGKKPFNRPNNYNNRPNNRPENNRPNNRPDNNKPQPTNKPPADKCDFCGRLGHKESECRQQKAFLARGKGKDKK